KSGKRELPYGGSRMHVYSLGAQNIKKVSVTQGQPEPQTGRIQGIVVNLVRRTRGATVKHAD
ncbi:unnamed protein product, partial [Prunus brigantina]